MVYGSGVVLVRDILEDEHVKRKHFEVTLADAEGKILAQETKFALNSGIRASEGLVREYARNAGVPLWGRQSSRVGDVYRRTWGPQRGGSTTVVATVASRIEV